MVCYNSKILVFDSCTVKKFSDSYGVIHVYVKLWWGFTNPSNVISFVRTLTDGHTATDVIGGK